METVGRAVERALASLNLLRQATAGQAVERWVEVVGPDVARHARALAVRQQVLFVAADSTVWLQELLLRRETIRARVNHLLGGDYVRDVRVELAGSRLEARLGRPQGRDFASDATDPGAVPLSPEEWAQPMTEAEAAGARAIAESVPDRRLAERVARAYVRHRRWSARQRQPRPDA